MDFSLDEHATPTSHRAYRNRSSPHHDTDMVTEPTVPPHIRVPRGRDPPRYEFRDTDKDKEDDDDDDDEEEDGEGDDGEEGPPVVLESRRVDSDEQKRQNDTKSPGDRRLSSHRSHHSHHHHRHGERHIPGSVTISPNDEKRLLRRQSSRSHTGNENDTPRRGPKSSASDVMALHGFDKKREGMFKREWARDVDGPFTQKDGFGGVELADEERGALKKKGSVMDKLRRGIGRLLKSGKEDEWEEEEGALPEDIAGQKNPPQPKLDLGAYYPAQRSQPSQSPPTDGPNGRSKTVDVDVRKERQPQPRQQSDSSGHFDDMMPPLQLEPSPRQNPPSDTGPLTSRLAGGSAVETTSSHPESTPPLPPTIHALRNEARRQRRESRRRMRTERGMSNPDLNEHSSDEGSVEDFDEQISSFRLQKDKRMERPPHGAARVPLSPRDIAARNAHIERTLALERQLSEATLEKEEEEEEEEREEGGVTPLDVVVPPPAQDQSLFAGREKEARERDRNFRHYADPREEHATRPMLRDTIPERRLDHGQRGPRTATRNTPPLAYSIYAKGPDRDSMFPPRQDDEEVEEEKLREEEAVAEAGREERTPLINPNQDGTSRHTAGRVPVPPLRRDDLENIQAHSALSTRATPREPKRLPGGYTEEDCDDFDPYSEEPDFRTPRTSMSPFARYVMPYADGDEPVEAPPSRYSQPYYSTGVDYDDYGYDYDGTGYDEAGVTELGGYSSPEFGRNQAATWHDEQPKARSDYQRDDYGATPQRYDGYAPRSDYPPPGRVEDWTRAPESPSRDWRLRMSQGSPQSPQGPALSVRNAAREREREKSELARMTAQRERAREELREKLVKVDALQLSARRGMVAGTNAPQSMYYDEKTVFDERGVGVSTSPRYHRVDSSFPVRDDGEEEARLASLGSFHFGNPNPRGGNV